MSKKISICLFVLFFVSGFCGLLYQTIWLRLAFAAFGVITPVLSLVVSVFMLGLALGSYFGGQLIVRIPSRFNLSALFFYAIAEAIIGLGAFAVPALFAGARTQLLALGESNSFEYLLLSALGITVSLLPWCFCMGSTFPFMMEYMKECRTDDRRSFSRLYLANCLGAMFGTLITAVLLIELLGFKTTLWVGAAGNFSVALTSFLLALKARAGTSKTPEQKNPAETKEEARPLAKEALLILFACGFASMAMEVVWTREFLYVIGTEVYAFSELLFTYLLATCIGSYVYRKEAESGKLKALWLSLLALAFACLLPLLLNDPILDTALTATGVAIFRLFFPSAHPDLTLLMHDLFVFIALFSIVPCSYLFGYITPRVIDEFSQGSAKAAGTYYAVNTIACILGPLAASYILLPLGGSKYSLIVLSLPFLLFAIPHLKTMSRKKLWLGAASAALVSVLCIFAVSTYEDLPTRFKMPSKVSRDYAATVVAFGEGRARNLIVNGDHVTSLNQCVKDMAHIPLAVHSGKVESALVICFGMGTTFKALLSWPLEVTAVELVPSVLKSFTFFHDNAEALLKNKHAHVIIDDGRRFLSRSPEKFDLITIDPSPVMEKGCMSLLFSDEFMKLAKEHLKENGIMQFFFAEGEERMCQAVFRTVSDNFKYVRVFNDPGDGFFCFASNSPLDFSDPEEILEAMPATARKDMLEWLSSQEDRPPGSPESLLLWHLNWFLDHEIPLATLLNPDKSLKVCDDKPVNEYHLLRNTKARLDGSYKILKPPFPYKTRSSRSGSAAPDKLESSAGKDKIQHD